jgi:Na+/H+ antiporter NhaD/arsenite permease-like protein
MLLPLGDPPLFLGYLNGVSFLWTLSLWKSWLFVNGSLLAVYFAVDHFFYYPREKQQDIAADERQIRRLSFFGLWPNGALLAGIVLSVALLDPGQPFPGTSWHPWIYLREMTQLALVAVSLLRGPVAVREANDFNYVAIVEVGALFLGIFVAMQPALEILNARGASLGIDTPREFFWASGWLSSVLDNAPTYLVFFQTAQSLSTDVTHRVAGVAEPLLTGISLGAVTMGAMTYIGNGPNFMVKTIAEQSSVRMPSFFGYMIYSFLVLLPILAMNTLLFIE